MGAVLKQFSIGTDNIYKGLEKMKKIILILASYFSPFGNGGQLKIG
jgi:hypothetical protein